MSPCLFCRITKGEMPVPFVWEDEEFVAFRDIDPKAPVHVLVVPRQHLATLDELSDLDPAYAGRFLKAVVAVARQEGLGDSDRGFRLVTNNGPEGGQTVLHLHGHVLGGRRLTWPPG